MHQKLGIKSDAEIRSPILFLNIRSHDELKSLVFQRHQQNQIKATQHMKSLQVAGMNCGIFLSGLREGRRECGRTQSSQSSLLP